MRRFFGGWGLAVWPLFALLGCGDGAAAPGLITATACSGTFNACGGDPTGTWELVTLCVEGDLVSGLNADMATEDPACANTFSAARLAMGGQVTYGDGNYSFDATMEMAETITYTPACVSAVRPGLVLSASVCGQLEDGLNREPGSKMTCSYTGTSCDCQGTLVHVNNTSGTYTVDGSTITEDSGTSYEYCVSGGTMTQREVVAGGVYGITQMKKR